MNQLKAAYAAAKQLWAKLPHQVQAAIVIAVSASATSLHHALSDPSACLQFHCLRHYLVTAVITGIVAGRAFYMLPSKPQPTLQQ